MTHTTIERFTEDLLRYIADRKIKIICPFCKQERFGEEREDYYGNWIFSCTNCEFWGLFRDLFEGHSGDPQKHAEDYERTLKERIKEKEREITELEEVLNKKAKI